MRYSDDDPYGFKVTATDTEFAVKLIGPAMIPWLSTGADYKTS
jgi:hypothetical protein